MQKAISLSSGEAELGAQVSGVSEALGIRLLLKDFSIDCGVISKCDSSAARGALVRTGAGRMKHLSIKHLWIQGYVERKEVDVQWIPRAQNPSDVLTHASTKAELLRNLALIGCSLSIASLRPNGHQTEEGCWNLCTIPSCNHPPRYLHSALPHHDGTLTRSHFGF